MRGKHEVPPTGRTMGVPGIYRVFDKPRCGCGQYTGLVLSN